MGATISHMNDLRIRVMVVAISMAGISCLHAQLLTTQAPITNTAQITVLGDVQLNAGTALTNNGALRVQGDWTNNSGTSGIAPASTGNVQLFGGGQNVAGTSVTDFRHLVISGGNKTLQQNAVVGTPGQPDGTLTLNGAVLILNGRTFSVMNPAATAVVDGGGSIRSETIDLLSRFQWALGNDVAEHRIPFSNAAGVPLPFAFTPAAPYPPNTLLGVATYPTAPNNTPYAITNDQEVLHISGAFIPDNSLNTVDRFWLTDLPNGNFSGTLLLAHTPADDPAFGPGAVRAQRWIESTGTWQQPLPGQSNPALREVRVPAIPFSHTINPVNEHIWALAYDHTPLPIELLHFGAQAMEDRYVHCTWTTATEINNDFFTVERSRDAIHFEAVGDVPGAGNSTTTLHYAFDDMQPHRGLSYYRLRQTDFDGTQSWSGIVPVWFHAANELTVFPNPNAGAFTILRSAAEHALDLQLLDPSGRLVRNWTMPAGTERQGVDMDLASGLYTLRWSGGHVKVSVGR